MVNISPCCYTVNEGAVLNCIQCGVPGSLDWWGPSSLPAQCCERLEPRM
jgi:hypothetical protein